MSFCVVLLFVFFFFNDTATTEIYTLSLHDALPISASALWSREDAGRLHGGSGGGRRGDLADHHQGRPGRSRRGARRRDRKSTRLNSSHSQISYAVFCLKKKKKNKNQHVATCQQS